MTETVALWCATAGCMHAPAPGAKYCFRCTRTRVNAAAQTPPPLSLFDAPRASLPESLAGPIRGKASTSQRAAEAVAPSYASKKALILAHIQACAAHGATRPELAQALGIPVNSINSACNTLYRQGCIGSNPEHERPDPLTGNACAVLCDEAYVLRWYGKPRRERSSLVDDWFPVPGECDLVHPETGASLTLHTREKMIADVMRDVMQRSATQLENMSDADAARLDEDDDDSGHPGHPSHYGDG